MSVGNHGENSEEIKNLSVKIEETEVLNDISFGVEEEIAAIIGPNGAAKRCSSKR